MRDGASSAWCRAKERGLPEFGGCLLATGTVEVLKGKISPEGKCSVFFAPFLLTQFFSQRTHLSILCDSYLDEFRPPGNCEPLVIHPAAFLSRITACQSLALRGGGRW